MYKKLINILVSSILFLLLLSGCAVPYDYGLKTIMLMEAPFKLIYAIERDHDLNLSGGKVKTFREQNDGRYLIESLLICSLEYAHTNADFSREGVYLVNIAKRRWFFFWERYFQFTIQIASPDKYNISAVVPEDKFTFEELAPTYCENATAIMTSPPNNIIYPMGYTGEVDPSGIVVKPAKGWFLERYDISDLDYTLESDVDFNTPGNYIVKVAFTDEKGKEYWFCFTVAVAESAK